MDTTPNLNLPIPNADAVPPTMISEEFPRLADALIMLDAIIFALQGMVAGKAESDHTQAISTITGLTEALAAKMPANATFSLDSLTDVQGAADALVNYVLVKKASGQWEPSTALAALGIHNHSISEVVGLTEQLVDILNDLTLKADAIAARVRFYASGSALPTSNVGPIWHADYASIMTWQTFNANGANYTGYASAEIGSPRLDGQSAARPGWLKRNGGSYSKTAYAPLWNWALHNGRVVTLGTWAAGAFVFADNGDGTFKLPDNRGEFERVWDDGRGIDAGRALGTSQLDAVQNATGTLSNALFNATGQTDGVLQYGLSTGDANLSVGGGQRRQGALSFDLSRQVRTSDQTRPRNVALLGTIKF